MSFSRELDKRVEGDFEHPNQELRRSIAIALCFAFILSTVAVGLRLWARRITSHKMFLDDWLIVVALLFKYGCSTGVTILLWNGLGSHITMIPAKNLEVYFKIGWSNSFVYTGCILFIKLSILTLYKRLFSTKPMILTVNILIACVILWAIGVMVAGALLCLPVNKFWDQSLPGYCVDSAKFYYGQQIPNIVTDFIMLLLPIKVVWALPITMSQKIGLCGVFIVGGLTLVFDIVRLVAIIKFTNSGSDMTYNQVPVAVWTCLEAAVGITAACLSHLRPLLQLGQRKLRPQSPNATEEYGQELLDSKYKGPLSQGTTLTDASTIYVKSSVYVESSKA